MQVQSCKSKKAPINDRLTLICIKRVPRDPSAIFLATSFTQKMPEKFYVSLHSICWKTYDTIILPEVDRIRKKLWTLFQFSSGLALIWLQIFTGNEKRNEMPKPNNHDIFATGTVMQIKKALKDDRLTLTCIKWNPRDLSAIFLATSFIQKMPERFYAFLHFYAKRHMIP